MFAAISDCVFPSFSKFSPIRFVIDRLLGTDNIKCLSLGHGHLKAGSILTQQQFRCCHASPGSPPVVITWAGRDGNSMTPSTRLNEWCSLKGLVLSDRKAREFEAFDRSKFKRASIAAVCLATHSYTCRLSSFIKNPLEGCPKGKRLEHFEAEISALGNALRGKALAPGYVWCIL